ncbi:Protein kinase domain-containing protein [Entamoeba marina]
MNFQDTSETNPYLESINSDIKKLPNKKRCKSMKNSTNHAVEIKFFVITCPEQYHTILECLDENLLRKFNVKKNFKRKTYKLPYMSYSLTHCLKEYDINLGSKYKLPHFESLLCDILLILKEKSFPVIHLSDFYIYDEREKLSAFGEVHYFFDVTSNSIYNFLDKDKVSTADANFQQLVHTKKPPTATHADIIRFFHEIRDIVATQNVCDDSFLRFIFRLEQMTNYEEQLWNDPYVNQLTRRKYGQAIPSNELYFVFSGTEIPIDSIQKKELYTKTKRIRDEKRGTYNEKQIYYFESPKGNIEHLGSGAMGACFKGVWKKGNESTLVVLKVFIRKGSSDKDIYKSYMKEAGLLSVVYDQPNIINYLGCFEFGNHYVLVSKYYDTVMKDWFGSFYSNTTVNSKITAQLIADIVKFACCVHGMGITHRDHKIENIFVHDESQSDSSSKKSITTPRAILADFGFSIAKSETNEGNTVILTPGINTPEMDKNKVDMYAIGIVLSNFLINETTSDYVDRKKWRIYKAYEQQDNRRYQELSKSLRDKLECEITNFQETCPQRFSGASDEFYAVLIELKHVVLDALETEEDQLSWEKLEQFGEYLINYLKNSCGHTYKPYGQTQEPQFHVCAQFAFDVFEKHFTTMNNKSFNYIEHSVSKSGLESFGVVFGLVKEMLNVSNNLDDFEFMSHCKMVLQSLEAFEPKNEKGCCRHLYGLINKRLSE